MMESQEAASTAADPVQGAQTRLAKACLAMPMDPMRAAISSYVNAALQSARIDALEEIVLHGVPEGRASLEALQDALVRHLTKRAQQMEDQANAGNAQLQRLQVVRADEMPRGPRRQ